MALIEAKQGERPLLHMYCWRYHFPPLRTLQINKTLNSIPNVMVCRD